MIGFLEIKFQLTNFIFLKEKGKDCESFLAAY